MDFSTHNNGILHEHLNKAFLKEQYLNSIKLKGISFLLYQGIEYDLYTTYSLRRILEENPNTEVLCIISYQQHKNGDNIAVAKLYNTFKQQYYSASTATNSNKGH